MVFCDVIDLAMFIYLYMCRYTFGVNIIDIVAVVNVKFGRVTSQNCAYILKFAAIITLSSKVMLFRNFI